MDVLLDQQVVISDIAIISVVGALHFPFDAIEVRRTLFHCC